MSTTPMHPPTSKPKHPSFLNMDAFLTMCHAMHTVGFSVMESDKFPKFCYDLDFGSQAAGTWKSYYCNWQGVVFDTWDNYVICQDVFSPDAPAVIAAHVSRQQPLHMTDEEAVLHDMKVERGR